MLLKCDEIARQVKLSLSHKSEEQRKALVAEILIHEPHYSELADDLEATKKDYPISIDGLCGGQKEQQCLWSKFEYCCSRLGFCGSKLEHCDVSKGCQPTYGHCYRTIAGNNVEIDRPLSDNSIGSHDSQQEITAESKEPTKKYLISSDGQCDGKKKQHCM
ncbi:hypothetical protein B0O99DRAFT_55234 [Bisporella sp. PMI_857]|nr:hypothetical protein B0O99DRAFT_55234 [Bisporella sp. PMI_857]